MTHPIILALDSANNTSSVAVSSGSDILVHIDDYRQSMQAENLLPMIQQALKEAKMNYKDVDYLAITTGPGSFTGIRIGLATALGIITASPNIISVNITNLEIAYYRAQQQVRNYDKLLVLLNAYRGQLYVQEFDSSGYGTTPMLLDNQDVIDYLNLAKERIVCSGSGILEISHKLFVSENLIMLPRFTRVKALHICRYAYSKINKNDYSRDLRPLYIRPPDAKLPS